MGLDSVMYLHLVNMASIDFFFVFLFQFYYILLYISEYIGHFSNVVEKEHWRTRDISVKANLSSLLSVGFRVEY